MSLACISLGSFSPLLKHHHQEELTRSQGWTTALNAQKCKLKQPFFSVQYPASSPHHSNRIWPQIAYHLKLKGQQTSFSRSSPKQHLTRKDKGVKLLLKAIGARSKGPTFGITPVSVMVTEQHLKPKRHERSACGVASFSQPIRN